MNYAVRLIMLGVYFLCLSVNVWASDDSLMTLQHQWARCQYQQPDAKTKESCFEKLEVQATAIQKQEPARADLKVWLAIVKSTYAGSKGGLGALSLVKQAKTLLEEVIVQDPNVLDGSAYTSLGSLYYQVPSWPVGFGDDEQASILLKKALSINPNGIDPNYFYADYLLEEGKKEQAKQYFEKALQAPPRPGREDADAGRRNEIKAKLAVFNE